MLFLRTLASQYPPKILTLEFSVRHRGRALRIRRRRLSSVVIAVWILRLAQILDGIQDIIEHGPRVVDTVHVGVLVRKVGRLPRISAAALRKDGESRLNRAAAGGWVRGIETDYQSAGENGHVESVAGDL